MERLYSHPEEMSKRDFYKMTSNPGNISLKDSYGLVITVDSVVIFSDTQMSKDGVEQEGIVTAVRDADGTIYCTNSPYFRRDLEKIMRTVYDPADPDPIQVEVIEGQSKSGRTFTGCRLI